MWVLLFDWPTEHRWPTWTPFLSIIRFENGKLIKIKLQFPSEPPPRIYQNLFKGSLHSLLLAKRLIEAFVQSGALQKLTYKGTFTLSIVVTANTSDDERRHPPMWGWCETTTDYPIVIIQNPLVSEQWDNQVTLDMIKTVISKLFVRWYLLL